jgi:hypothetical protein
MINVSLSLYRERKTRNYLILRYAKTYAVGKFVPISTLEMRDKGLDIVLKYLKDEPPPRTGEKPELNTFSKEEERAFYRNHQHVTIAFGKPEILELHPMYRQGSGFVSHREEVIQVPLPCTNEQFLDALDRAYAAI